jgi:hypothetical protein
MVIVPLGCLLRNGKARSPALGERCLTADRIQGRRRRANLNTITSGQRAAAGHLFVELDHLFVA